MKKQSRLIYASLFLLTCFLNAQDQTRPSLEDKSVHLYDIIEDKAKIPVLTPSLSKRQTAKIRLKNGLEALLISDPDTNESGAALSVNVGSWSDPKEYPGMAHFLEHMLFMGTTPYPDEAEYMKFINDHGGSVNAFTAPDRTVYSYSINNDFFEGALDRFSQFFISPLFSSSCVDRELLAVDQEFSKNLEVDGIREYFILKEQGNQNHPNAAFSIGNAATLRGIPPSALKAWYKEHYSANIMHLTAVSTLPIEVLKNIISAKFSSVENHRVSLRTFEEDLLSDNLRGHALYIKPIKDSKILTITWQVPAIFAQDFQRRPAEIVAYALSSREKNNLSQQLKNEDLAENVSITSDRLNKDTLFFQIDIALTNGGIKKVDTIIEKTFEAIASLKRCGIPRYIFDDVQTMSKIHYQYQSRENTFSYVTNIASSLIEEPIESFPEKLSIPQIYDGQFLQDFVQTLTPSTALFTVIADPKLTEKKPTRKEKWMGAEYELEPIPEEKLSKWAQMPPSKAFLLPPPNIFIPRNLTCPIKSTSSLEQMVVLEESNLGKVYSYQDNTYLVPEVVTLFNIKDPSLNESPRATVLLDLYFKALDDVLYELNASAYFAGLNLSVGSGEFSLSLALSGYNEKAPLFLKQIFETLKKTTCSLQQFKTYKDSLLSSYNNGSKNLAISQAFEKMSRVILETNCTNQEKVSALQAISFEDFQKFSKELFKHAYVEGLFCGDIPSSQAQKIWGDLKKALNYKPFPKEEHFQNLVVKINPEKGPFQILQNTPVMGNGAALLLQLGEFSFPKKAAQQILSSALQTDFFDTLRTKQQTGYIALSRDLEVQLHLFQMFATQSISHEPSDLLWRFELFLEDIVQNIEEKISKERFETLKKNAITNLKLPQDNLGAKAQELSTLAFLYEGDFKWIEKRISALEALSYEDFILFTKEFLSRKNLQRLAVLYKGVIPEKSRFDYKTINDKDEKEALSYPLTSSRQGVLQKEGEHHFKAQ